MKFYKLSYSYNRKEVGTYPQCQETVDIGDMQKDFIPIDKKIDINFKLPELKLEKRSKQNSIFKAGMIPIRFLVLDNSLLHFLTHYNIDKYQSWKINVWQNKELLTKYNMFSTDNGKQEDCISFTESIFRLGTYSDFTFKGDIIKIKNYNDYQQKKETFNKDGIWIRHEKIVYNFDNIEEDLFRTVFDIHYFVSERLKKAIEKEKFTGIKFTVLK